MARLCSLRLLSAMIVLKLPMVPRLIASEAGLLLEPLLLLDKVQTSHEYAREYLRCDDSPTSRLLSNSRTVPGLPSLAEVSCVQRATHRNARQVRLQCCPMRSTQAAAQ